MRGITVIDTIYLDGEIRHPKPVVIVGHIIDADKKSRRIQQYGGSLFVSGKELWVKIVGVEVDDHVEVKEFFMKGRIRNGKGKPLTNDGGHFIVIYNPKEELMKTLLGEEVA